MNFLFQVQLIAKRDVTETAFRSSIAPVVSILDDLSGICDRKDGTLKCYRPGELIDAPETWAARWQVVLGMGASRHQVLLSLMQSLQPLLESQLPSCILQWRVE